MFLLHLPAIDDEDYVVDGDGGLRDISGQHNLLDTTRRGFEDELLLLSRQGSVKRQDAETLLVTK